MTPQIENVTAENFEERVLRSDLPALVDFHRSLCLPCQKLSPTIDKLAEAYADSDTVRVFRCEDDQLFERLKVQFVPQPILFVSGKDHWIDRNIKSIEGLQKEIEKLLARAPRHEAE